MVNTAAERKTTLKRKRRVWDNIQIEGQPRSAVQCRGDSTDDDVVDADERIEDA